MMMQNTIYAFMLTVCCSLSVTSDIACMKKLFFKHKPTQKVGKLKAAEIFAGKHRYKVGFGLLVVAAFWYTAYQKQLKKKGSKKNLGTLTQFEIQKQLEARQLLLENEQAAIKLVNGRVSAYCVRVGAIADKLQSIIAWYKECDQDLPLNFSHALQACGLLLHGKAVEEVGAVKLMQKLNQEITSANVKKIKRIREFAERYFAHLEKIVAALEIALERDELHTISSEIIAEYQQLEHCI